MGSSMQATLISLTEQIAAALASEFKLYLPQIIPHALKIFMYDESPAKAVTLQVHSRKMSIVKLTFRITWIYR